jgi:hypothetical protein
VDPALDGHGLVHVGGYPAEQDFHVASFPYGCRLFYRVFAEGLESAPF